MNDSKSTDKEILLSIFQTAAYMRRRGLSDRDIENRLIEVGFVSDTARAAVQGLADFLKKTGGLGRVKGPPKIFLSHSHRDRDTAAYLQKTLEEKGVRTFLDQHQIVPGQKLEDRLSLGLIWCDRFLLLWSAHANGSKFVHWEWKRADRLVKDIVPYVLDSTPLPRRLARLVFIDSSDQTHGHAQLLRTVLGRGWKPASPAALFPGLWRAQLSLLGFGEAEYELELRANGQVVGNGRIRQSGLMGGLARDLGLSQVLSMNIPINGTWSYNDRDNILQLDITATLMGQTSRDVVTVRTTGEEKGWLQAQTLGGLPWRLTRVR
jgi:hypothetical protein